MTTLATLAPSERRTAARLRKEGYVRIQLREAHDLIDDSAPVKRQLVAIGHPEKMPVVIDLKPRKVHLQLPRGGGAA